ncbi:hypothetical protein ACVBEF_09720 [Glaciimonas sp. GG7]
MLRGSHIFLPPAGSDDQLASLKHVISLIRLAAGKCGSANDGVGQVPRQKQRQRQRQRQRQLQKQRQPQPQPQLQKQLQLQLQRQRQLWLRLHFKNNFNIKSAIAY